MSEILLNDKFLKNRLNKPISDNKLIPFVGSGLSKDIINVKGNKIGLWDDLLRSMLMHLKGKGCDTGSLNNSIDDLKPIDILRVIEKRELNERSAGIF